MADELKGKKIAILAADGVEQVELDRPREAVERAGAETELLSIETGEIQAVEHDIEPTERIPVDKAVGDATVEDYDGLILPGGVGNPDKLRKEDSVIDFVQAFFKTGKPVGVICHGPWTLVEADLVRGRTLTSYPSIRTDIRNAGGEVVDEEVRHRSGPGLEPQSERPRRLLRQDRGGVRRGPARGRRGGRDRMSGQRCRDRRGHRSRLHGADPAARVRWHARVGSDDDRRRRARGGRSARARLHLLRRRRGGNRRFGPGAAGRGVRPIRRATDLGADAPRRPQPRWPGDRGDGDRRRRHRDLGPAGEAPRLLARRQPRPSARIDRRLWQRRLHLAYRRRACRATRRLGRPGLPRREDEGRSRPRPPPRPACHGARGDRPRRHADGRGAFDRREARLGSEKELVVINEHFAEVRWIEGPRAFLITAEEAHDATGKTVPTSLSIEDGDILNLTVHHKESGVVYPVLAGQAYETSYHPAEVIGPLTNPEPLPFVEAGGTEAEDEALNAAEPLTPAELQELTDALTGGSGPHRDPSKPVPLKLANHILRRHVVQQSVPAPAIASVGGPGGNGTGGWEKVFHVAAYSCSDANCDIWHVHYADETDFALNRTGSRSGNVEYATPHGGVHCGPEVEWWWSFNVEIETVTAGTRGPNEVERGSSEHLTYWCKYHERVLYVPTLEDTNIDTADTVLIDQVYANGYQSIFTQNWNTGLSVD